jgi:hypothetical protein
VTPAHAPAPSPAPRARRRIVAALAILAVLLASAALRRDAGVPDPVPSAPPGLADLWAGRAALVLDRLWSSPSLGAPAGGAYAGAHVEIADGTWYLFNRRTETQDCPGSGKAMATQVRASADQGATWGAPATIVAPTPGTPWACAASDGDAVFDAAGGTWRYLFQCAGAAPGWNGCYAERHDRSPLGPFSAPQPDPNPVIANGQLWAGVCAASGDRCARGPGQRPVGDEGTFSLLPDDRGGWWVGFHGYDGVHGYRGIARTETFRRDGWQVDGAGGTPTDAVLTAADAAGWRERWHAGGPVGAGAASLIEEGGWYYQLAEVPDDNLACTPGQNWNLGLFRARSLASTRWEQYPAGNPVVYSSQAPEATGVSIPCNVEYPGLFMDPATGRTYLMHGRISADAARDGIYVYRLEWNRNLLANPDFWRADAEAWHALERTTTQLAVKRLPDGSPDGTPYLSFDCGAATCDGQGVYQDVAVTDRLRGQSVAFGGALRTDAGAGRVDVALLQLGASHEVLQSTVVPADASPAYASVRGRATVDDGAVRLRFQLYPRTPGGLAADNLYVIPDTGCTAPRYPAC